jgi:hypothetical protein
MLLTPSPHKKGGNVTHMIVSDHSANKSDLQTINNLQTINSLQTINKSDLQTINKNGSSTLPLPDARQMDWTTLVDTATKAISVTSGDNNSTTVEDLDDEEIEIADGSNAKEIHSHR